MWVRVPPPAPLGRCRALVDNNTGGVLLTVITQPMLIVAGPTILALLIRRNVILASAILFIPLPLVCWWLGVSGLLVAYSIALPSLVGFTHFLRVGQRVIRHA